MVATHLIFLRCLIVASATLPGPCSSFSTPASAPALASGSRSRDLRNFGNFRKRYGNGLRLGSPSTNSSPSRLLRMSTKPLADPDHAVRENVQLAIDEFISSVQASLDDSSFESFTLKGPSAPRKRRKNKKSNDGTSDIDAKLEQQKERLRGKFKQISGRLVLLQEKKKAPRKRKASRSGDGGDAVSLYLQTTIKYHLATDVAKNWRIAEPQNSEQSEVERGLRQIFLTAMGDIIDDESSDAPLSEWGSKNINGELGILSGELVTSNGVYKLQLQPHHKASFRVSKKKASQTNENASGQTGDLSHLSHDRSKNVPLLPSAEFFQRLGVSNADRKPMNGMASKLRQCQKFVEIVGNLVGSSPPSNIRVVDMGCGRGYLTFALHSYLCEKFGGMDEVSRIETRGIDRRPKLIEEINGIARDLGGPFATLGFVEGTIGETHNGILGDGKSRKNAENVDSLDILIALHACDTATDDAMWSAIGRQADIIVTAPCCQHELRPQIDRHAADNPNDPWSDILRHAIYRERSTEIVTDAMRAILLEIAGYETNVFEFIGGEHTAKNVMITATRTKKRRSDKEQEYWLKGRRRKLADLAQSYGIRRQRLAMLMGENIAPHDCKKATAKRRNSTRMAPLEL